MKRKRLRLAFLIAAFALVWVGCSDQATKPQPPQRLPILSGHVEIRGILTDASGTQVGTRTIGDANSVTVRLRKPDGGTDSTWTSAGRYEFHDLAPGIYQVVAWVSSERRISTRDVTVAAADVSVPDTLRLASTGEFSTQPNPFPFLDGVAIFFTSTTSQHHETRVLTMSGRTIWTNVIDYTPGLYHVHWIGVDQLGHSMPPGPYWIVVRYDDQDHYNLVFKRSG